MSKLKMLREVHNYTQEFIAETLGMDQSTYSKLEKNPRNLKAEQAEKLAVLYSLEVEDILSNDTIFVYSHNTINTIDKGYVHNLYEQKDMFEQVMASKDSQISLLKEEVEQLRKQNEQLLKMLEKGR